MRRPSPYFLLLSCVLQVAPCNCTVDADAECEFGYHKVKGSCVPMPGLEDVNSLCPVGLPLELAV